MSVLRRFGVDRLLGLVLVLTVLAWGLRHRHQPANHIMDAMMIFGLVGMLLLLRAAWRDAKRLYS